MTTFTEQEREYQREQNRLDRELKERPVAGLLSVDGLMQTILYNDCGSGEPDGDGWNLYRIETHCVGFMIKARFTGLNKDTLEIAGYRTFDV